MVKLPNCRATQSSISATSCSQIDAHDPAQFELQTHMYDVHTDSSKRGHACTDGRALSSTGCATYTLSACAPHIALNLAASLDGNCIGMDGFGRGAEPIGAAWQ
jgi:hypothetical protein